MSIKEHVLREIMENLIYGVDPGTAETGWVIWDGKKPVEFGITPNKEFLAMLREATSPMPMYIEMVAAMGMIVGQTTFKTVFWTGRFIEAWSANGFPWHLCYRTKIKLHHCGQARAKDANVAQALRDKYGEKGTKKSPGPMYGVSSHIWSAIAIAAYASEIPLACNSSLE